MTYEKVRSVSLEVLAATADIPQRRFVTYVATNGLSLPATAGDSVDIVGVTLEAYDDSEADLGRAATMIPVGLLDGAKIEVEAGAAIAVGVTVIAANDGRAVASTTTAGGTTPAGEYQELGVVVEAAGAAGEIATIQSFRGRVVTTR